MSNWNGAVVVGVPTDVGTVVVGVANWNGADVLGVANYNGAVVQLVWPTTYRHRVGVADQLQRHRCPVGVSNWMSVPL